MSRLVISTLFKSQFNWGQTPKNDRLLEDDEISVFAGPVLV